MLKFLLFPVIVILLVLSIFYVSSVTAHRDEDVKKPQVSTPVTKITVVDYKVPNNPTSSPQTANNGKKPEDERGQGQGECYAFLSDGAKLQTPPDITLNFNNSNMDSPGFIVDSLNNAMNEWNTKSGNKIFGNLNTDSVVTINNSQPDGKNVVAFVSNPDSNIVSVTNVWGHFGKNSSDITEFDIALNSSIIWGDATQKSTVEDLPNVITHALGHTAGLGDVSSKSCSQATMFSTFPAGEIIKRDLAPSDIKGIQRIYK